MQQYAENMAQYLETASAILPKDLRAIRHCRAALRPDITAEREYLLVDADSFDFSAMQYAERFVDTQIKDNFLYKENASHRHTNRDLSR